MKYQVECTEHFIWHDVIEAPNKYEAEKIANAKWTAGEYSGEGSSGGIGDFQAEAQFPVTDPEDNPHPGAGFHIAKEF